MKGRKMQKEASVMAEREANAENETSMRQKWNINKEN